MRGKYLLRFSRSFCASFTAAAFVFLLSIVIMPLYTGGDQSVYRKVYEALPAFNLTKGFLFYSQSLTSTEFIHFFSSWVASRFVDKDLFIAFSNAILAYLAMSFFLKRKASIAIGFLLIATNFYFLVLYFAAERLKFGFIFLALSVIHIDSIKRFFGFAALAVISHVSIIIVYASIVFDPFVRQILKLFNTGKIRKTSLFILLFSFIPLLMVQDQIIEKFYSYYDERSLAELGRIVVFFMLAFWYSDKKSETIGLFIPLALAVFLLGGYRVNLFGYFVFLYYGLRFKGGWNFGVLTTSVYFAYSSMNFLVNIVQHGNGFFVGSH